MKPFTVGNCHCFAEVETADDWEDVTGRRQEKSENEPGGDSSKLKTLGAASQAEGRASAYG